MTSKRNYGKIKNIFSSKAEKVYEYGIDAIFSITDSPMILEEVIENSGNLLIKFGRNIGRLLLYIKSRSLCYKKQ